MIPPKRIRSSRAVRLTPLAVRSSLGTRWSGIVAIATGVVGCGGASPAAQEPQVPPPAAASAAVAVEPVGVAAEPEDLIVVGRVSKPGPLLDKFGEWSGFPLPWQDLLTQSYPQIQGVLVPGAPVDFAVAMDATAKNMPDFHGVVSLPLADYAQGINALKNSGQPASTNAEGEPYVSLQDDTECTVARANGPTPARLICGDHDSVERLTPFVATNLPQQNVGDGDVYAELRMRPIHARYGKRAPLLKMMVPMLLREASLQNPRFDAALANSAHAVADDLLVFINEADKLTLKVALDEPKQEASAEVGFQFRGEKSFLASATAHAAKSESGPPGIFWNLPAGAVSASFSTPSSAFPRLQGVSETLGELIGGALEHAGLASGVIDAWVADFKSIINAGGGSAWAHVATIGDTSEKSGAASAESLPAALGCEIGAIEGDNGALVRLLDSTVKMVNDQKLRVELGKRLSEDFKKLPVVSVKNAPARFGLPAGAKVYSLTLPQDHAQTLAKAHLGEERAKKQGALLLQLFVVNQNSRTWFSAGADEALVVASLKRALTGAEAGSIALDPAFARWREARVVSGSTFQLRELFSPSLFSDASDSDLEKFGRIKRAMPHGGTKPLHAELTANAAGPLSSLKFVVPRPALEEIAAAIVAAIAENEAPAPDPAGTPEK